MSTFILTEKIIAIFQAHVKKFETIYIKQIDTNNFKTSSEFENFENLPSHEILETLAKDRNF